MRLLVVVLILAGVPFPLMSSAQPLTPRPVLIGAVQAAPSSRASGVLEVPAGVDQGAIIPITIVNGSRPGPLLALIGGIHGAEYSPILALQTLADRLDAARLSGAVVIVHVASVEAFFARSVYVNPIDRKNVNRSFPGRADGSHSERLAHVLTQQVITPADVVIDVHSGDANESLTPWVGYYAHHGSPATVARSRQLAVAFGERFVVRFPGGPYAPHEAVYTGATAATLGKPTFDVEIGERGTIDQAAAGRIQDGLLRVMRELGMIQEAPDTSEVPVYIERRESVTAPGDGVFYPDLAAGARVRKGDRLGVTTDLFGGNRTEHRAPVDGVVLMILSAPPVRAGETVAVVADLP